MRLHLGREGLGLKRKASMPPKRSTPITMHRAGELRKEPGPAEIKLWTYLRILRKDGIHFRRQYAIGPYITDFSAPRNHLVIEVDGSQHMDQEVYDRERTAFLESKGFHVLRFWNSDVMNKVNDVMGAILEDLEKLNP
jgi:very-short-patch-repair endonuclease